MTNFTKTSTNEYKRRHDSVHWQFCEKLGFNRARLWYEHEPDIVVVDKVKKEIMIIDVAIPTDTKVCDKKQEKIEKYILLNNEIARLWQMKKVVVILILVGALETITTKFDKYIDSLGIEIRIEHVQKSALLGTAIIIRKVLSCQVPTKAYCCETFDIWLMSALTAKNRDTKISVLGEITLNMIMVIITSQYIIKICRISKHRVLNKCGQKHAKENAVTTRSELVLQHLFSRLPGKLNWS